MDVPELVVIYVNSSSLAKGYDSGPLSRQREGGPESQPLASEDDVNYVDYLTDFLYASQFLLHCINIF